ncbi:hypothetical protein LVD15_14110 [Fulvivirga maritima]|uniref:hypothetical protein n=1 Tax=Fulvivirga maritima TaxID=2904247 RepID=UPI001F1FD9FD|nr:hypothetical protein [Fulvivirga maritima]UII24457.1 hypothetical protein LVD15_14110 [Fulvivirga maritima]
MKLPQNIDKISLFPANEMGPYPPNGFLPFHEAEMGNGDYYGLYWEFGKENDEPVICEMIHDEGSIRPVFSSLDKFLEWYSLYEENDFEYPDEEVEDDNFLFAHLNKGNECLRQNNIEEAIHHYQLSTKSFGEVSENWFKLASQQKRLGDELAFQKSLIHAVCSNWAIEVPSQNALRMLNSLKPVEELKNHPLIKNRQYLSFSFGGQKVNDEYVVLSEMIEELYQIGEDNAGFLMEQNYALMMYWETTSFQERYNFDLNDWKKQFALKTKNRLIKELS